MKPIIVAKELGKKYCIQHHGQTPYRSLRDEILNWPRSFFSKKPGKEEFWALRGVDFEIMPGDRVGIIGRNGAGKSTLLKLLSRITEPSTGQITIRGRVASLLEVGTGFHPELTGRENIFLNGAILGMTRFEVRQKFDEIVDFAGVEKFLDTPVKRYSSGMYVRLAFAVAAHLEPEILVVDEVLAVGDAEFQKKCLGKMEEVSRGEGRTVLFVSHNMTAIRQLCTKGILLKDGTLDFCSEDISQTIKYYSSTTGFQTSWSRSDVDSQNDYFDPHDFYLSDVHGKRVDGSVQPSESIICNVVGDIKTESSGFNIGIAIYNEFSDCLFWSFTTDSEPQSWLSQRPRLIHYQLEIPKYLLNEGQYRIELLSSVHNCMWILAPGQTPATLNVHVCGKLSDSPFLCVRRPTLLSPVFEWKDVS